MKELEEFDNTWCKASSSNEIELARVGIKGFCADTDDTEIYYIKDNGFIPISKIGLELFKDCREIYFANGQFHYMVNKNLPNVSIENANKYKEMFNQGITDEQKEELEQLGINKTPECQFAKFGFEAPEFEGEILKELSDHNGKKYFIGYSIDVREGIGFPYPKTWTEDGKCFNDDDIKIDGFDLTPIKKPWYEDESNFPCLALDTKHDVWTVLYRKSEVINSDEERYELATKEEVLSLYKEEK